MGAEIDRLEIAIESKSTKVNNSLDTLVTKLDKVSGALSHLNNGGLATLSDGVAKFSQASALLSNVKTADFTRLAENIQSLTDLNTQQIFSASSAIKTLSNAVNALSGASAGSSQVVALADSVGKLGGANVQRAITNLPALGNAMNDLMTTLSRAPQVSDNIIRMTAALAGFAVSLKGVRASASDAGKNSDNLKKMSTVMDSLSGKAQKTQTSFIALSQAIGTFYANFGLLIRGIKKLWAGAESSMDYVETFNYWNVTLGKIDKADSV